MLSFCIIVLEKYPFEKSFKYYCNFMNRILNILNARIPFWFSMRIQNAQNLIVVFIQWHLDFFKTVENDKIEICTTLLHYVTISYVHKLLKNSFASLKIRVAHNPVLLLSLGNWNIIIRIVNKEVLIPEIWQGNKKCIDLWPVLTNEKYASLQRILFWNFLFELIHIQIQK